MAGEERRLTMAIPKAAGAGRVPQSCDQREISSDRITGMQIDRLTGRNIERSLIQRRHD